MNTFTNHCGGGGVADLGEGTATPSTSHSHPSEVPPLTQDCKKDATETTTRKKVTAYERGFRLNTNTALTSNNAKEWKLFVDAFPTNMSV